MTLFHLLLLVFSTHFVSSAWTCPKDTLNLGPASGSYPENGYAYAPNQECSFKILVEKNNYIQIFLRYNLTLGDSIQVSDDLGFNYSFVNSSSYTTFSSPVDLYIKFNASSGQEGTFFFNWKSNSILQHKPHYLRAYYVEDQKEGPMSFVTNDDLSSITHHPLVIYKNTTVLFVSRGSFTSSFDSDLDAKSYFILSGGISSDSYLGSLYDVLKNGPMFFSGNGSVIIFKVTQARGKYCFLFKLASEVEGLDYSIECMDTVHSVTLNATKKPQVVTVINSNPRYPNVFLRNIWFNSNQNAQLDHLPGSTTPPFEPIASFRPPDLGFGGVIKYVPGVARTFVAYNGIINIFLDSTYRNEISLEKAVKGTTGMIPSINYPFSQFLQNTSISLFSPESQLEIKFDCLNCYNSFSITAINGTTFVNSAGNYSLGMHQSITIVGNNFTINYPATRDYGLLSFSVVKAVSNKNFFISAIFVFFFSI